MSLQPKTAYSFDDYLAVEREAVDTKHEYVAGHVYAMTGASYHHNLIAANLVRRLGNQLDAGPCTVLSNDMRVRVEAADASTYPDVVALCDEPAFHDERSDVLTNPILLIEVLSPSTEGYDRGGKFALYRALPSLRQYVLVAQDRYSVDVFTRRDDNRWVLTAYSEPDDLIRFDAIACAVPMSEIYARVRFEPEETCNHAG
ncbi:Uma2 family endonuclease [uncultured Thiocystis sp.]|jgi:Uma2 family endonuclease|uniref:Uma2 family endonuclease n=1 Tax=uncultured Thiocystis sp. TaxID=1202134 RepID=UPI0025D90E7A|nr:Uma2 family endonuclease [uncultured Thiocystis sp.]